MLKLYVFVMHAWKGVGQDDKENLVTFFFSFFALCVIENSMNVRFTVCSSSKHW